MSLLMEALRKAEEAKRRADGENAAAAPATASIAEPTLTPPIGAPAANPLPNLSQHLDAVDADLAAVSAAPPPRRPPLAEDPAEERSAAHNVFAAKQQPGPGTSGIPWLIAGVGLLAILGIGGYFWWQLQSIQSPAAIGRSLAASPAMAMPISAAPSAAPPVPAERSDAIRPRPEAFPPPSSAEKPAMPARPAAAPQPPAHPSGTPAPTGAGLHSEAAGTAFRLTRTTPQADTTLERAYEALQAGHDEEAWHAYEQALRADGKSTDALLGLATLAARQGQNDTAHTYYLRALETDPSDATARAGVLCTARQGDADAVESRLKTALSSQPGSPQLLFVLGNLYAREQRWNEAQQAYFQAYTGESGDPDIIFNLAVSLDHLRQGKLAAQYYRMALDAGDARTAAFNREQVSARLLELQP